MKKAPAVPPTFNFIIAPLQNSPLFFSSLPRLCSQSSKSVHHLLRTLSVYGEAQLNWSRPSPLKYKDLPHPSCPSSSLAILIFRLPDLDSRSNCHSFHPVIMDYSQHFYGSGGAQPYQFLGIPPPTPSHSHSVASDEFNQQSPVVRMPSERVCCLPRFWGRGANGKAAAG